MTKEQLEATLNVSGGQFMFSTKKQEGMIGVCPSYIFIWVDDKEGSDLTAEPKNVGEFETIREMLEQFVVNGQPFSESVLPDIEKLEQLYT